MKKRKLLLTLGSLTLGLTPIFAIISCGQTSIKTKEHEKKITTSDAQSALNTFNQSNLNIFGYDGAGTFKPDGIHYSYLWAMDDLKNVTITADKMTDIANGDAITLIATPKSGYAFSGGETYLTHQITISGLPTAIGTAIAQTALDTIDQAVLNISVNSGSVGTIAQTTLDALAIDNLKNVTITADEMTNIQNGSTITLIATPKSGYVFSGGETHLTHPIIVSRISELSTVIRINTSDVQSALDAIDQDALNLAPDNSVKNSPWRRYYIFQKKLDALATGNLANVTITADMLRYSSIFSLTSGQLLTLIATPKPGYAFSGDEPHLTHQIKIV